MDFNSKKARHAQWTVVIMSRMVMSWLAWGNPMGQLLSQHSSNSTDSSSSQSIKCSTSDDKVHGHLVMKDSH